MSEVDVDIDDKDRLYLALDTDTSDRSMYAHTVTLNGNCALSSTQKKYGGKSLYFPGDSGDYVAIADNAIFDIWADTTWFEIWMWPDSVAGFQVVVDRSAFGFQHNLLCINSGAVYMTFGISGGDLAGGTLTAQTWNHVAWKRDRSTWTLYVNGTSVNSNTASGAALDSAYDICLGRYYDNNYRFKGYLQGLRYRALTLPAPGAFTPRTTQYNQRVTQPTLSRVMANESFRFSSAVKTGTLSLDNVAVSAGGNAVFEQHTDNEVLVSASVPGNYKDANLTESNVKNGITFGLSGTGSYVASALTDEQSQKLDELWRFKGFSTALPLAASGDGITEKILTSGTVTLTIHGTGVTRT